MVYGSLLTKCGVNQDKCYAGTGGGSGTASYQDNDAKMYFMEAVDQLAQQVMKAPVNDGIVYNERSKYYKI